MIGGIFQGILPRISFYNDSKVKIISFLIAGGAVYFFLWKVYEEKRNNMYYGKLKIEHKGISLEGNYFLDSGNKLVESISGKPVLVTSAKWLFGPLSPEMLFFRPVVYKSVGKEKGVLDAYCVDLVVIYGKERTYKYEKVWVGICREELFSGKDYQIILPPLYGVQGE